MAMKPKDLLLHVLTQCEDDSLWVACCLDFTLAAQASTEKEALRKLMVQVGEYIEDATVGVDHAHANELLRRRAPLSEWLTFWAVYSWQKVRPMRCVEATFESVPLVPAHC